GPLLPPRVLPYPLEDGVERDLDRLATDRQIADHAEVVPLLGVRPLDPLAPEGDRGVLIRVQEVRRAKVLVTVVHAGVDARRRDLDLDHGALGVLLVRLDPAVYLP